MFVTRSRTPYEVDFKSPAGEELDNLSIHIAVEPFLRVVEMRYPGMAERVGVMDFFGRDEILWTICLTCAELLAARVPGKSHRVAALTELFAAHLVEKYTSVAEQPAHRGGLPIHQLRKVQDYIAEHLAEEVSVEQLAELAGLSPSHFAHVFKETTGVTPIQFVTRQRVTRAQGKAVASRATSRRRTSTRKISARPWISSACNLQWTASASASSAFAVGAAWR